MQFFHFEHCLYYIALVEEVVCFHLPNEVQKEEQEEPDEEEEQEEDL